MAAEIEVVFTDGGDQFATGDQTPGSAAGDGRPVTPPPNGPQRTEPTTGPDSAGSSRVWSELLSASANLAGLFGAGGLFKAVVDLSKAFYDLYATVQRSTQIEQQRQGEPLSSGVEIEDITPHPPKSPRGPRRDDIIEGEFISLNGPKSNGDEGGPTVPDLDNLLKIPHNVPALPGPKANQIGLPAPAPASAATPTVRAAGLAGPAAGAAAAEAGAAASAASGLASLAAAAGPAAAAVAVLTAAVGAAVIAIKTVVGVLNEQVQALQEFSPEISEEVARSDVRRQQDLIERNERIGPDVARFENLRSRWESRMADLQTELLTVVLDLVKDLEPVLEGGLRYMDVMIAQVGAIAAGYATQRDLFDPSKWRELPDDIKRSRTAVDRLVKAYEQLLAIEKEKEDGFADPFLDQFLGQFTDDPNNPLPPAPLPPAPGV